MVRSWASIAFALLLAVALVTAVEVKVQLEDMPMSGPLNKPGHVEEKWGSTEEWQKGGVIQLNDNNFEHLTQATSGATTGDWFVMFGAPWCSFCSEEMMVLNWNQTSRDLKGEVNVAYMDASNNPFTALRFNITAYPTFIFIRRGRAYVYTGLRYWKNMVAFARLDWEGTDSFAIPPAHGTFDELVYNMQQYSGQLYELWERRPWFFLASVVGGIVFGVLLPYGYILSAKMDPSFGEIKRVAEKPALKVWDASTGTTVSVPLSALKEVDESENGIIEQVEVDADTVEIVTEQSPAVIDAAQRKSKKNKKRN
jgi:hypothetical protein